jgi:hypothetical protein
MRLTAIRLLTLLVIVFGSASTLAETYISAHLGLSLPHGLTDVNLLAPNDRKLSDLDLKNSLAYGAKLGHYWEGAKWLGIETEIFRSSPHLVQQPLRTTTVSSGTTAVTMEPGAMLNITTWAFNVVLRYPGQRLQPYAGIGPALFFARLRSEAPTSTFGEAQALNLGVNTQVGLRYLWKSNVSMFGEWKYNHARLSFDSFPNANYNAHLLVFGVGYHFR